MADLSARVLGYIRKHGLLRPGDRVGVAVSGGADSVALLRLLLELRNELGTVLSVVHFNHRLRGADADADEAFVRELAAEHRLQFHAGSGDTRQFASSQKLSIETAARELRYRYFRSLLEDRSHALDDIATAHTLDDQAETVLMRMLRGTGLTGLTGIHPALAINEPEPKVSMVPHICPPLADVGSTNTDAPPTARSIIRPLLGIRRNEIEYYLRELHQPWRTDTTNLDVKYTRNRVRHELLPLLERDFNPSIKERLSELAESARGDDEYCESHALAEAIHARIPRPHTFYGAEPDSAAAKVRNRDVRLAIPEHERIDLDRWKPLHIAVKRRLVRDILCGMGPVPDFGHVEAVLELANSSESNSALSLPAGICVRRRTEHDDRGRIAGHYLVFEKRHPAAASEFAYMLNVPGEVRVVELSSLFRARLVHLNSTCAGETKELAAPSSPSEASYNSNQLLSPQLLSSELLVRSWRPGDRFWPAHTSSPKKVKELLQQKHVTGPARATWPVVVSGDEIVWMRGFPVPEKYRPPEDAVTALVIEEVR